MVPNEPREGAATVSRLIEHDSAKAARILGSAREILAWIEEVIDQIARDPCVVLPRRLAPLLIKSTMDNPWLRRLRSDEDALWQVLQRDADWEWSAESSPSAMCGEVIAIPKAPGDRRPGRADARPGTYRFARRPSAHSVWA